MEIISVQSTLHWELHSSNPLFFPFYLFSPFTIIFTYSTSEKLMEVSPAICIFPLQGGSLSETRNLEFGTSLATFLKPPLTMLIGSLQILSVILICYLRIISKDFLLMIFLYCLLYFTWLSCSIYCRQFTLKARYSGRNLLWPLVCWNVNQRKNFLD